MQVQVSLKREIEYIYYSNNNRDFDGRLSNRNVAVKKFRNTEKNIQNHIKALKKQKNIFFNQDKNTSNLRELNNINNIKKKNYDSLRSNNISVSSELDYIKFSTSSISDWEGEKKNNYLDHIVSTNIKSNQVNEVIYNEVKFYSRNSLANNTVNYPLPIVTLSLRGGKNYR